MSSPFCTSALTKQACLFDIKGKLSEVQVLLMVCQVSVHSSLLYPPHFNRSVLLHPYWHKIVSVFLCSLEVGRIE